MQKGYASKNDKKSIWQVMLQNSCWISVSLNYCTQFIVHWIFVFD